MSAPLPRSACVLSHFLAGDGTRLSRSDSDSNDAFVTSFKEDRLKLRKSKRRLTLPSMFGRARSRFWDFLEDSASVAENGFWRGRCKSTHLAAQVTKQDDVAGCGIWRTGQMNAYVRLEVRTNRSSKELWTVPHLRKEQLSPHVILQRATIDQGRRTGHCIRRLQDRPSGTCLHHNYRWTTKCTTPTKGTTPIERR
jgi:hypothetical protein